MNDIRYLTEHDAFEALDSDDGRHRLELIHSFVGECLDKHRKHAANDIENLLEFENIDWQLRIDETEDYIVNLSQKGNMIVAKQGNKPVGMAGIQYIGCNPYNQADVYEIVRVSVLEEVEGKGIAQKLIDLGIQQNRSKQPDADIVLTTSTEAMKHISRKKGFNLMPPKRYFQIKHSTKDIAEEQIDAYEDEYLMLEH